MYLIRRVSAVVRVALTGSQWFGIRASAVPCRAGPVRFGDDKHGGGVRGPESLSCSDIYLEYLHESAGNPNANIFTRW